MTHTGIECFLSICRHKTISRAAEALYITQSSLSIRLKTLEAELGGALFFRQRGSREITLTPAGRDFYELALRYEALEEEMKNVCKKQIKPFRVSFFNSLGTYLLPQVIDLFIKKNPHLRLELQDMELDSAYQSLQNGLTDLAFTAGKINNERLEQIPVFREPMILLCGKKLKLPAVVTAGHLPRDREVCVEWSRSFMHWHEETFPDSAPQITISIMSHLQQFLDSGESWAIVPLSVAEGLLKECDLRTVSTAFEIPSRKISVLISTNNQSPAIDSFCECLKETLSKYREIKFLLP